MEGQSLAARRQAPSSILLRSSPSNMAGQCQACPRVPRQALCSWEQIRWAASSSFRGHPAMRHPPAACHLQAVHLATHRRLLAFHRPLCSRSLLRHRAIHTCPPRCHLAWAGSCCLAGRLATSHQECHQPCGAWPPRGSKEQRRWDQGASRDLLASLANHHHGWAVHRNSPSHSSSRLAARGSHRRSMATPCS